MENSINKDLVKENEKLKKQIASHKKRQKRNRERLFFISNKGTGLLLGGRLKRTIKKFIKEIASKDGISNDTIAELISNIFYRFTRIGLFSLLIALIPISILIIQTIILDKQTERLDIQNELMKEQALRLEQQTYLIEADRRSSLSLQYGNILDKLYSELEDEPTLNPSSNLSHSLKAQIVGLSSALKPYYYLDGETLIDRPKSPERGQLLKTLLETEIDSVDLSEITSRSDFSSSELNNYQIFEENLIRLNIDNSELMNTDIIYSRIENSSFRKSKFQNSQIIDTWIERSNFDESLFYRVSFSRDVVFYGSRFHNTVFNRVEFYDSYLNNSDFFNTSFVDSYFSPNTGFGGSSFEIVNFKKSYLCDAECFAYSTFDCVDLDSAFVPSTDWIIKADSLITKSGICPSLSDKFYVDIYNPIMTKYSNDPYYYIKSKDISEN